MCKFGDILKVFRSMFKISREIHAVMTTEPAIKGRNSVGKKKQDGGHGNDADGPIVFSDELLSAKKIRRMRRSLHTIAKEESVRPGILFSGRSDKNVMIFPLSFLQLFAVTQWQCNFRQRRLVFWHLIKDILFSFRRLKIHFLSIFCLIRRHGV